LNLWSVHSIYLLCQVLWGPNGLVRSIMMAFIRFDGLGSLMSGPSGESAVVRAQLAVINLASGATLSTMAADWNRRGVEEST